MKKIYISPSDQDANPYATGGTNEAEQCRKIALALAAELERNGFQAKTNVTDEMEQRVAESNLWGADIHLCIHTNAFNGQVQGTRMFSYDLEGEGYQLCQALMAHLSPITPGSSDSIRSWPGLYEVRNSNAPTAYVEVGFHDNEEEAGWIIENTGRIAEALARGFCDHYNVPWKSEGNGIYNDLDEVPAYAKNTIEKLMEKDYLIGNSQGLQLTENMVRLLVINDRAGLYD